MRAEETVKENRDFRRIYRKGRSAVSACLVVYCRRHGTGNRLGVTVSTKVGKAVTRNKVRRRLREIYRLNREKLRPGYDVILVARSRAAFTPYKELEEAYLSLLQKLDIMAEEKV